MAPGMLALDTVPTGAANNSRPYRCINIAYLGISRSLQGFEVMQQLLLDRRIGGHAEGELSLEVE